MLITMHQKTKLDCILSLSSVFKKERKIPIWEVQLAPSPCWCKLVTESSWRRNCQSVWGDIWEQLNGWRDLDWRRRGGSCIELELSKCPDHCCAQYKSWKSKRDQTISRVFLPPVALASHNKSTVVLLALQVATQICPLDKKFCWPMNHWARSWSCSSRSRSRRRSSTVHCNAIGKQISSKDHSEKRFFEKYFKAQSGSACNPFWTYSPT